MLTAAVDTKEEALQNFKEFSSFANPYLRTTLVKAVARLAENNNVSRGSECILLLLLEL